MRKKVMLTIGAMSIAAIIGLLFSQHLFASADPDLTIEDIKKQVEAQYPGKIVELELENEGKEPVYEVELEMNGQEYELRIDGNSGKVIRLHEKLTTSKQREDSSFEITEKEKNESVKEEKNEKGSDEADNKQTETKEKSTNSERNTMISRERAIEIAQEQFSGAVDDIDLEEDDGKVFYEIDIESSRGEAEIEIDAFTGKVLMVDIDLEDD